MYVYVPFESETCQSSSDTYLFTSVWNLILLQGIGPRVLWIGIGGSIFFGVLERTKRFLAQNLPDNVTSKKD